MDGIKIMTIIIAKSVDKLSNDDPKNKSMVIYILLV